MANEIFIDILRYAAVVIKPHNSPNNEAIKKQNPFSPLYYCRNRSSIHLFRTNE